MKKKIFITLTLFLLIGIISTCLLSQYNKNFLKEKIFWNWENKNSPKNNENNLKNDNEENNSSTIEEETLIINEESEENTSTTSNNESKKDESVAKQETSVTKNNENKTEQKSIMDEKQSNLTTSSTQSKETTPIAETTPSCTPKKFDMSFVRADFTSKKACDDLGKVYYEAGYGYFCDDYQDDCLTTYYMLTIYERNTGIEYDFHTIPLP